MQLESTHNGKFIGASAGRTNGNKLMLYVIFGNGDTVTFDAEGYIVRGNIPVNDDRIEAAWLLASRLAA